MATKERKEAGLLICARSVIPVGRDYTETAFARGLMLGRAIEMNLEPWQELNLHNIIKARCNGVSA